jgi:hypothetical protein
MDGFTVKTLGDRKMMALLFLQLGSFLHIDKSTTSKD